MQVKRRLALIAGTSVVLLAAGFGLAQASIPDGSGVIHACYKTPVPTHGSALSVIDTGAGGSCGGGMTALTWNQTGPQGPAGAAGATGATGAQGPAGLSGVNVVSEGPIEDDSTYEIDCPAGQVALSVVFAQDGGVPGTVFDSTVDARPVLNGSGQPTGYMYQSDNGSVFTYHAYLTCATVAS